MLSGNEEGKEGAEENQQVENSGAHCWAKSLVLLVWRTSELQSAGPAFPGSPGQHAVGLAQMPVGWPVCPAAHPRVAAPSVVKAACLGV